jgi:hypothetical protein
MSPYSSHTGHLGHSEIRLSYSIASTPDCFSKLGRVSLSFLFQSILSLIVWVFSFELPLQFYFLSLIFPYGFIPLFSFSLFFPLLGTETKPTYSRVGYSPSELSPQLSWEELSPPLSTTHSYSNSSRFSSLKNWDDKRSRLRKRLKSH